MILCGQIRAELGGQTWAENTHPVFYHIIKERIVFNEQKPLSL